ncbi:glutaredoxin family protein [Saccharophagus degradans]|uniref:glutaredoxin family protein n=1 Tax=Saccharophagus degradans TaxID=86304 RepID=UPI001C09166F|nr:glutaredoxin family protein [Saccharophagus degradans]MBU2984195.1 glutaredoxin family protein [Saccharophagus degradans]WGO96722.1 glutaredoxin family protein [Saccharophagus degradans]
MPVYHFTLFSTLGCHLCEVAQSVLVHAACIDEASIGVCDIATDDELIKLYGESIPVLQHNNSGQELKWPFDEDALQQFMRGLPEASSGEQ